MGIASFFRGLKPAASGLRCSILLGILLACTPALAQAEGGSLLRELAVYTGPVDADTTVEAVADPSQAENFQVLSRDFSAGYDSSAHWFRLRLDAPPPGRLGERVLHVVAKPSFLGSLILYQPDNGGFSASVNGMTVPYQARPYPDRRLSFLVEFPDNSPRTVYLRLQTSSSAFLDLSVMQPVEYRHSNVTELLLIGLYLGLVVAGAVNTLWHRQWARDPLQRTFLLFLVVMLVHFLGTSGLTAQLVFPDTPGVAWLMVAFGAYVVSAVVLRLFIHAFALHEAPKWLFWTYQGVFWTAIILLPAPLLNLHSQATQIIVTMGSFVLFLGTLWSLRLLVLRQAGSVALLIANLFPLVGALITSLMLLGFLPGSALFFSAFQLGLLGSLVAFQILLAQRRRWLEQAYVRARRQVRQAEERAEWEQTRADEKRQFMSMLTHELKTPLSLIRLRLGAQSPSALMQGNALQAVSDIDGIIDRCAIANRIEDGRASVRWQPMLLLDQVEHAVAMLGAPERLELTYPDQGEELTIQSDPVLLRTVISNLLDNALKYSREGTPVTVVVESCSRFKRQGYRLQVCNEVGSAGVPDAASVFSKYYRGRDASRVSGSGLGLYIVGQFVSALGGTVHYKAPEAGASEVCFELWMPKEPVHPLPR